VNATAKQQLRRNVTNDPYTNPTKTYSVPSTTNDDGTINIPAQPVYLIDPSVEPISAQNNVRVTGASAQVADTSNTGFLTLGQTSGCLIAQVIPMLRNQANNNYEAQRTPHSFQTLGLTTAAGATTIWAAAVGVQHRILVMTVDIAAGTTAAGACVLTILDNATTIYTVTICGGALAASAGRNLINVQFPGNGYLQLAANTAIAVNLSSVLAAGGITANMWGSDG